MSFEQRLSKGPGLLGPRRRTLLLCVCALAVAALIAVLMKIGRSNPTNRSRNVHMPIGPAAVPSLGLPAPDLVRSITPEEALKENAERAFSNRPDTPAATFVIRTSATSYERALECMTQAIYYEAASEGADGQRAVAQVVLNRVRHPAYPSAICSVVYQGSERQTGCQFSFTCDGSLVQLPAPALWRQARRVAAEALAGEVFKAVGHSTHYHADYVLPYWADSLDKSVKIGRHIFYRLKGNLGASSAFRQRYGGSEVLPTPPSAIVEIVTETGQDPGLLISPPDTNVIAAPTGELLAPEPSEIAADATAGKLLIDGGTVEPSATRRPKAGDCPKQDGGKQLRPMSRNDVRIQSGSANCS
jgi:hypothetical protein